MELPRHRTEEGQAVREVDELHWTTRESDHPF